MDPLFLGTSVVNCMCGLMKSTWCKNFWLCSAFWMTMASSRYLSHGLGGANGFGFKLFYEHVCYNGTKGGTHGWALEQFIILTLEQEVGIFNQNSSRVMIFVWRWRSCCVVVSPIVIFAWWWRIHWHRYEDILHIIGWNALPFFQPDELYVVYKGVGCS